MRMYALYSHSMYSINESNSDHNENINQSINRSMRIIHACGVN